MAVGKEERERETEEEKGREVEREKKKRDNLYSNFSLIVGVHKVGYLR